MPPPDCPVPPAVSTKSVSFQPVSRLPASGPSELVEILYRAYGGSSSESTTVRSAQLPIQSPVPLVASSQSCNSPPGGQLIFFDATVTEVNRSGSLSSPFQPTASARLHPAPVAHPNATIV